jgi:hypothetical protein
MQQSWQFYSDYIIAQDDRPPGCTTRQLLENADGLKHDISQFRLDGP